MIQYTLLEYTRVAATTLTWGNFAAPTLHYTWKVKIMEASTYWFWLRTIEVTIVCYSNASQQEIERKWRKELYKTHKKMDCIIDEVHCFIKDYEPAKLSIIEVVFIRPLLELRNKCREFFKRVRVQLFV